MYKHAFECKKCPKRNDVDGCPGWWEIIYEELNTNAVKVEKGCYLTHLPKMMVEVIKASNRPAAAVESCRNEIVNGFSNVSSALRFIGESSVRLIEE